ncbi:MAG: pyridoxal phosphate-dependent decarboxylase family protein [Lentisphaeria bacterium]
MTNSLFQKYTKLFEDVLLAEKLAPNTPYSSPDEMLKSIDITINTQGSNVDEILALLKSVAEKSTKTSSHTFFNQLFGGRIDIATVADMLATLLNISMYTYKVGTINVLIEKEVTQRMCQLANFPNGEGIFTPGGSLSNMAAMIMARNEANHNIKDHGISRPMTAYTSCQSHYSLTKNANLIGIGRQNMRLIDVDDRGHMNVRHLESTIIKDIQHGFLPFFINATCGTTVYGAFDPIDEIANIAEKYSIWLHADGAWGGSLLLNKAYQHLFKGLNRANSFTWDAHKMMGVPLIASCILVRDKNIMQRHFSEPADYLFQADCDSLNPGTRSMQCGRRNDALKVWAAWKMLGDQGYSNRIDQQRNLTLYLAKKIDADPLLVLHNPNPESLNVCFDVPGKSSEEICQKLDQDGRIKVGYGAFKGNIFIRTICVNPDLSFQDLDNFIFHIHQVANSIKPSC